MRSLAANETDGTLFMLQLQRILRVMRTTCIANIGKSCRMVLNAIGDMYSIVSPVAYTAASGGRLLLLRTMACWTMASVLCSASPWPRVTRFSMHLSPDSYFALLRHKPEACSTETCSDTHVTGLQALRESLQCFLGNAQCTDASRR